MNTRPLHLAAALAAAAGVLAATGPAQARPVVPQPVTVTDPTGDVSAWPSHTKAATSIDVSEAVFNGTVDGDLRIRVDIAAVNKKVDQVVEATVRVPGGGTYTVYANARVDGGVTVVGQQPDIRRPQLCSGGDVSAKPKTDRIVVRVPASCISSPDKVTVDSFAVTGRHLAGRWSSLDPVEAAAGVEVRLAVATEPSAPPKR